MPNFKIALMNDVELSVDADEIEVETCEDTSSSDGCASRLCHWWKISKDESVVAAIPFGEVRYIVKRD